MKNIKLFSISALLCAVAVSGLSSCSDEGSLMAEMKSDITLIVSQRQSILVGGDGALIVPAGNFYAKIEDPDLVDLDGYTLEAWGIGSTVINIYSDENYTKFVKAIHVTCLPTTKITLTPGEVLNFQDIPEIKALGLKYIYKSDFESTNENTVQLVDNKNSNFSLEGMQPGTAYVEGVVASDIYYAGYHPYDPVIVEVTVTPYNGSAPFDFPADIQPYTMKDDVLAMMADYTISATGTDSFVYTNCETVTYNNFPLDEKIIFYFNQSNSVYPKGALMGVDVYPSGSREDVLAYMLTYFTLIPDRASSSVWSGYDSFTIDLTDWRWDISTRTGGDFVPWTILRFKP